MNFKKTLTLLTLGSAAALLSIGFTACANSTQPGT